MHGFLDRVWRMIVDDRADAMQLNAAVVDAEPTAEQNRMLHKTIQAVTRDIEQMAFNTAISRMMEFTNFFFKEERRPRTVMERFVQLLAPFAPHVAEELWELLGHAETLAYEPWPEYDPALLVEDTVEVPVQLNGKLRGRIQMAAGLDAADDRGGRPGRRPRRRAAGRQDGGQGDRGAGPDGEFRGAVKGVMVAEKPPHRIGSFSTAAPPPVLRRRTSTAVGPQGQWPCRPPASHPPTVGATKVSALP